MDHVTRGGLLNRATGMGLIAVLPAGAGAAAPEADRDESDQVDRECVVGSGMIEAEADCWEAVARAARLSFDLPELHPTDQPDVVNANHVMQYRLLNHPAYRKDRDLQKAAGDKKPG